MVGKSAELHLGIDLGSTQAKLVLHSPDGQYFCTTCLPSRGCHLSTLLQALNQIPEDSRMNGAVRVAVTGSGQDLLGGIGDYLAINEVADRWYKGRLFKWELFQPTLRRI